MGMRPRGERNVFPFAWELETHFLLVPTSSFSTFLAWVVAVQGKRRNRRSEIQFYAAFGTFEYVHSIQYPLNAFLPNLSLIKSTNIRKLQYIMWLATKYIGMVL